MKGEVTTNTREIQRILHDYSDNYAAVNWTTYKTWINSQKSPETEPGRYENMKQVVPVLKLNLLNEKSPNKESPGLNGFT